MASPLAFNIKTRPRRADDSPDLWHHDILWNQVFSDTLIVVIGSKEEETLKDQYPKQQLL